MSDLVFQTERLTIRPLRAGDFEAFQTMHANPNVMRYTSGQVQTPEESREELARLIAGYNAPGNTFWVWAVERRADGRFLGTCAFILNPDGEHEIGFRFDEPYWRQGFATEVARGLTAYITTQPEPGVKEVVAYVYSDNVGSVKALERASYSLVREFYNEEAKCLDREYRYSKK